MVYEQRLVLAVGTILVIAAGVFPPWNFVVSGPIRIVKPAGYRWLFSPPPIVTTADTSSPSGLSAPSAVEPTPEPGSRSLVFLPDEVKAIKDFISANPESYLHQSIPQKIESLRKLSKTYQTWTPKEQIDFVRLLEPRIRANRPWMHRYEIKTGSDPTYVSVQLDFQRLLVEWGTILLSIAGLALLVKRKS